MKLPLLLTLLMTAGALAEWRQALPGWEYEFPRDHYAHPEFKTEWWYFTGHLESEAGQRYGYQITFFRQGIRPPGSEPAPRSRFAREAFHFAHFAISDLSKKEFHFGEKISRGAFDEAGNGKAGDKRLAWIEDWHLELSGEHAFTFRAEVDGIELDLNLSTTKPPVFNGEDGVSQKAAGAGEATHYYAMGRLTGDGTITRDGKTTAVRSESWLDREWGSNQLGPGQTGWDWFSIQLDDGRELMIYQLRLINGTRDPHSSGTLVAKDGSSIHLTSDQFSLKPLKHWQSKATPGKYPIHWQVSLPDHGIDLKVAAEMPAQELALPLIAYWEGAVKATGTHTGKGYLEMTGYAAPLAVLRR